MFMHINFYGFYRIIPAVLCRALHQLSRALDYHSITRITDTYDTAQIRDHNNIIMVPKAIGESAAALATELAHAQILNLL